MHSGFIYFSSSTKSFLRKIIKYKFINNCNYAFSFRCLTFRYPLYHHEFFTAKTVQIKSYDKMKTHICYDLTIVPCLNNDGSLSLIRLSKLLTPSTNADAGWHNWRYSFDLSIICQIDFLHAILSKHKPWFYATKRATQRGAPENMSTF